MAGRRLHALNSHLSAPAGAPGLQPVRDGSSGAAAVKTVGIIMNGVTGAFCPLTKSSCQSFLQTLMQ